MELHEALRVGRALMDEHGLHDWTLELDRAKRRAGSCQYGVKRLTISRHLTVLHSREEVRETLLHEIAHALAGARHGHDATWRATARRIGASGERCLSSDSPTVEAPWVGTCPAGHTVTRHRTPTRLISCSQCSPAFSLDHLFAWRLRGEDAPMHPAYAAQLASARSTSAPQPLPGLPTPPLRVGQRVVVTGGGRYHGAVGVVVKRGRSRYQVRIKGAVLTVPFGLAEPARR